MLFAKDPEHDKIQKRLEDLQIPFVHATKNGVRVHPGNCYNGDPLDPMLTEGKLVVFIEGDCPSYVGKSVRIDHHNPGDYGYTKPPQLFWEGSSIGQLFAFLELALGIVCIPTLEEMEIAALDHCKAQAELGQCPGINPERAKIRSMELTAERLLKSYTEVLNRVSDMKEGIVTSPSISVGGCEVKDYSFETGIGYSLEYLCTQEAVIDLNCAAIIRNRNISDGPLKFMLYGAVETPSLDNYKKYAKEQQWDWKKTHVVKSRQYGLSFEKP